MNYGTSKTKKGYLISIYKFALTRKDASVFHNRRLAFAAQAPHQLKVPQQAHSYAAVPTVRFAVLDLPKKISLRVKSEKHQELYIQAKSLNVNKVSVTQLS